MNLKEFTTRFAKILLYFYAFLGVYYTLLHYAN